MDKIALGFSNTVDYEIEWNSEHLEKLIILTDLRKKDIQEKKEIKCLEDLLSSILFHMEEGSGCGFLTEYPDIITAFLKGCQYQIALGGTNLRAAEVISALGGQALVHLVSSNPETLSRIPEGISWIGGEKFNCCFPHIAIQFPKSAHIKANDIDIISPKENRVIYSGDLACSQMPLCSEFFTKASGAKALLLSSFDLISDPVILSLRLSEVKKELAAFGQSRPLIFYEHACFGSKLLESLVLKELSPYIDVYSMNEDEFQSLLGERINLLNEKSVLAGLDTVHKILSPHTSVIIHTCHWALVSGRGAETFSSPLRYAMLTASAKYMTGLVSRPSIEKVAQFSPQSSAAEFSDKICASSKHSLKCFPAADISISNPTTIGLGDSFVGGFLYKYCYDNK